MARGHPKVSPEVTIFFVSINKFGKSKYLIISIISKDGSNRWTGEANSGTINFNRFYELFHSSGPRSELVPNHIQVFCQKSFV